MAWRPTHTIRTLSFDSTKPPCEPTMNASGGGDSGATLKEDDGKPPAKNNNKSGRKPPKKSDAAATAAAELEKEIQKNERYGVDGGDAETEEGDEKPAASKDQKNMLVDHTYTNYALLSDKELGMLDEHSSLLPEPKSEEEKLVREKLMGMSCTYGPMKKSAGGVVQPFPGKVRTCMGYYFHFHLQIISALIVSSYDSFLLLPLLSSWTFSTDLTL